MIIIIINILIIIIRRRVLNNFYYITALKQYKSTIRHWIRAYNYKRIYLKHKIYIKKSRRITENDRKSMYVPNKSD